MVTSARVCNANCTKFSLFYVNNAIQLLSFCERSNTFAQHEWRAKRATSAVQKYYFSSKKIVIVLHCLHKIMKILCNFHCRPELMSPWVCNVKVILIAYPWWHQQGTAMKIALNFLYYMKIMQYPILLKD